MNKVSIWHLEARKPIGKIWRWLPDGTLEKKTIASPYEWRWYPRSVPHGDVAALAALLQESGRYGKTAWTTGEPVGGKVGSGIRRLKPRGKEGATFHEFAQAWLPIDLDHLQLDGVDVVNAPEIAVSRAVDQLGSTFADASYVWQFTASQRPDSDQIRLRLFFFTDTPITDTERKRWAAAHPAPIPIDASIYKSAGLIFIGLPQILSAKGEPCPDWLPIRCGYQEGERDAVSLVIPEAPTKPEPKATGKGEAIAAPWKLAGLCRAVQDAPEGEKHTALNKAAYTAGGLVAGGAFTLEDARAALQTAISGRAVDSLEAAFATIEQALADGQQAPISGESGSAPEPKELPELPESHRPSVYPKISARGAAQKTQRLAEDIYAHPRTADGAARIVVIRSATGIGKTKVVMDVARAATVKTLWLTPTHDLADEAEQRFDELDKAARAIEVGNLIQFQPHTATALRGRGAKAHESQAASPLFMCEKPKALRAIKNKNLSLYTKSLLCKTKDTAGVEVKCEFLQQGTCRYYRQMRDPAKVRCMAHNYLTTPTAELVSSHINEANYLTGQCPVIVIDESPIASLKRDCRWVDDDKKAAGALSAWMKDADLMRVAGAVLHGAVIPEAERTELLDRITAALGALTDTPPATRPSDCDEAIAAALNDFQPAHDPALKGMFLAAQRWLSGHKNTLWKGTQDGKPALFSQWYARVTVDSPILILDASADEAIYRAVFGDKVEFHGFDTPMAPGVNVTQVSDNTFYQRKLDATKALKKGVMDADQARRAHGLQARLAAFLMLAGAEQGQAGIVSYKGALDGIDADSGRTPGILDLIKTPALHYGNLVGMDTLKALPLLIVAGRQEPSALDMEAQARALWPEADLHLSGAYQQYRTHYTMRDGSQVATVVRQHPDWRVAACLRQVREEGLIQAIGRGRYIHSTGQRELIVACNVPVPGLIVDRLVTMDEILPERRLALALLKGKGTAPLSAGWLAENVGDEFKNENAARVWCESFKGSFPGNRYIYPGKLPLKTGEAELTEENFKPCFPGDRYLYPGKQGLKLVEYRLAGQRGGKPKRAVTKCADLQSATRALETLMAAPVASIRFEDDAPAVQPAATGNLAALLGGDFNASDYEPMNELEFADAQDWRWPDTPP
jgi:hypothetical protein